MASTVSWADTDLGGAQVGLERERLAVPRAAPRVEGRDERRLAHVLIEAGPQLRLRSARRPKRLRSARRHQTACRGTGNVHGCGQASQRGIRRTATELVDRRLRYHANTKV